MLTNRIANGKVHQNKCYFVRLFARPIFIMDYFLFIYFVARPIFVMDYFNLFSFFSGNFHIIYRNKKYIYI